MISKRQFRFQLPAAEILIESDLLAKGSAFAHRLDPLPFAGFDPSCSIDDFREPLVGKEQYAVHVRRDEVVRADGPRADLGAVETKVRPIAGHPMRPPRHRAERKHRETDLQQLGRVAMTSPDDDTREARMGGLKGNKIADARSVLPAVVVDDEDIARLGKSEGLEKNVDAVGMAGGANPACASHRGDKALEIIRCAPNLDADFDAGVRQMCGAQMVERVEED